MDSEQLPSQHRLAQILGRGTIYSTLPYEHVDQCNLDFLLLLPVIDYLAYSTYCINKLYGAYSPVAHNLFDSKAKGSGAVAAVVITGARKHTLVFYV